MKIAVFGGTGLLGVPVCTHLRDVGHVVRVVSRDAAKARTCFGDDFEIAEANVESGEGVRRAVADCQGVHISIDSKTEAECVRWIVGAAREAGLERVVYVSGLTVMPANSWFPLAARKLAAEQTLEESGIPWTVVAPGWFFETLGRFVRGGKATVIGDNPTPYHFIAADNLARIVGQTFETPEAANRRFVVKGPEGITIEEALRRYCAALHPEIEKIGHPPPWLLSIIALLTRNRVLKDAVDLMAYFKKVGEPGDPTETNALFGAPETTMEAWLKRRLS